MIINIHRMTNFPAAALAALVLGSPAFASAVDRQKARANFQQADVNQDQQLDVAEFETFINLNADHGLGRASTIRRFRAYGRAFGRLDSNRDGVVSAQEIAAQARR